MTQALLPLPLWDVDLLGLFLAIMCCLIVCITRVTSYHRLGCWWSHNIDNCALLEAPGKSSSPLFQLLGVSIVLYTTQKSVLLVRPLSPPQFMSLSCSIWKAHLVLNLWPIQIIQFNLSSSGLLNNSFLQIHLSLIMQHLVPSARTWHHSWPPSIRLTISHTSQFPDKWSVL